LYLHYSDAVHDRLVVVSDVPDVTKLVSKVGACVSAVDSKFFARIQGGQWITIILCSDSIVSANSLGLTGSNAFHASYYLKMKCKNLSLEIIKQI
jgi:hypothetical protein